MENNKSRHFLLQDFDYVGFENELEGDWKNSVDRKESGSLGFLCKTVDRFYCDNDLEIAIDVSNYNIKGFNFVVVNDANIDKKLELIGCLTKFTEKEELGSSESNRFKEYLEHLYNDAKESPIELMFGGMISADSISSTEDLERLIQILSDEDKGDFSADFYNWIAENPFRFEDLVSISRYLGYLEGITVDDISLEHRDNKKFNPFAYVSFAIHFDMFAEKRGLDVTFHDVVETVIEAADPANGLVPKDLGHIEIWESILAVYANCPFLKTSEFTELDFKEAMWFLVTTKHQLDPSSYPVIEVDNDHMGETEAIDFMEQDVCFNILKDATIYCTGIIHLSELSDFMGALEDPEVEKYDATLDGFQDFLKDFIYSRRYKTNLWKRQNF